MGALPLQSGFPFLNLLLLALGRNQRVVGHASIGPHSRRYQPQNPQAGCASSSVTRCLPAVPCNQCALHAGWFWRPRLPCLTVQAGCKLGDNACS
jgi:hypothetical protein